jgi:hypothetical protein
MNQLAHFFAAGAVRHGGFSHVLSGQLQHHL